MPLLAVGGRRTGAGVIEAQPDLELSVAEAERLLEAWLATPVACSAIRRLEGGLINSVLQVEFDRPPHRAVIKLHRTDSDDFAAEARSLEHLRTESACPVPAVYLHDSSGELIPHAFLLLEHIPGVCLKGLELDSDERADIDTQLADVLLELHSHTGRSWGGVSTPSSAASWGDLFAARLAEARRHPAVAERMSPRELDLVDRAIAAARSALSESGEPTLVHGDVWDGNIIIRRERGRWRIAGLLDPGAHYADVELELSYLEVFDVRRDALLAAYTRHSPLRPGYDRRRLFYWLRTALIHVALFGDDFFRQFTARTAKAIVG